MFGPLQRALFAEVRKDPTLPPMYDFVPEGSRRPYITFTSPWSAENDGLNFAADRAWFQLSCWSEYRGFSEVYEMDEKLVILLRGTTLRDPADPSKYFQVMGDNAHFMRDVDPRIRHGARTYYVPFYYLGRAVRSSA